MLQRCFRYYQASRVHVVRPARQYLYLGVTAQQIVHTE